ncbi:hypothetical protein [Aureibacter tunicatorum]|uniref:Lipoprotein n=1 Tax=Aureibacter tunicatorum TaxID=866807 RepID=A0AAE3XS96_9BACT|nr:hypothetical protein [Aureibacter tunicatorum]MDR6241094.1 hypothetical protein [Aureibacter tunicatorum]BDD03872.1 hypothetical protein AUTU_13550 [Aureibacter tunicatorum]
MKNLIIILGSILIGFGCQIKSKEKPNLEGDLYYTWLKLGSLYGLPERHYQNYIKLRDSLGIEELIKRDSIGKFHIELLEKNDLIQSPFVYIKTDSDSTFIVYMTPEEYEPITKYSYQDLIDSKQKIRLKLITERLNDKLQICKKVISIEKVDGETLQRQKKFKIEEYR